MYGDSLWVGAYADDQMGTLSGAAYVYSRAGEVASWSLSQKLVAQDGAAYDAFGWSLDMHQNISVVGAYGVSESIHGDAAEAKPYIGAVYVYRLRNGLWSQSGKLMASDGQGSAFFGWSVAVWDSVVIVGSRGWGSNLGVNVARGKVYPYHFVVLSGEVEWSEDLWIEGNPLIAPDDGVMYFGSALAMSKGNVVVSGRILTSTDESTDGIVYVFSSTGSYEWEDVAVLKPNTSMYSEYSDTYNDEFGYSVAIWDEVAVVGAVLADGVRASTGAAYTFIEDYDESALGFPVNDNTKLALLTVLPLMFAVMFSVVACALLCCKKDGSASESSNALEDSDSDEDDNYDGFDLSVSSQSPLQSSRAVLNLTSLP